MALEPLGAEWRPLILRAVQSLRLEGGLGQAAREFQEDWEVRVGTYLDEVVHWNRKVDLTAARTPEELVDLTVADALVVARFEPEDGPWVDVGSGAGAPGLVMALLRSDVRMTLVEPKDRRVAFLRSITGKLGVPGVTTRRGRSDVLARVEWNVAVSRATLGPADWLREGARLARRAVWVLLARDDPPSLPGWKEDTVVRYEWPLTGASRRAVRYVPICLENP